MNQIKFIEPPRVESFLQVVKTYTNNTSNKCYRCTLFTTNVKVKTT